MAIIEKVAALPSAETVDSLERMMKMQMEWEDRQEEREFNDAVARIQEKLQHVRIVKNKAVSYKANETAFKYALLEDIDKIVRPMLIEENIRPSYTTTPLNNGIYNVTCRLTRGRYFSESSIPLPIDTSGGKNNVQGMGSTFSYGKRYALCAALNIVTVGEDNDGMGAPITEEQAKEIKDGLKKSKLDVAKFLKTLKVESVEEITSRDYNRVLNTIQAKLYRDEQEAKKKGKTDE